VPFAANSNSVIRTAAVRFDHASLEFPPIYFLDFELYQRTVSSIPRVITTIRPELQALAEDIREQAKTYFVVIHPWVPLLSKKSFNERLLSPFTPRDVDLTILFASIKLICSVPASDDMRTHAYVLVKSSILEAEMAGVFSIRILQAWILLSVYEFAHAIYPSAQLSIGACAKYAAALGLNLKENNSQKQIFQWIEAEEKLRALWVIIILDR
jgi:hypothetical protein